MTRSLLSLVMILKNEASNIREVLRAALPHVDCGTILDTGSTDGTQQIVRDEFEAHGRALILVEEPFTTYADSRNRAFAHDTSDACFQLVLSGDEYLRKGEALRTHLEEYRESSVDCHFVQVTLDGVTQAQARIVRTGSAWKFEDADCGVHEFLVNRSGDPEIPLPIALAPGVTIEHVVSDPERRYESIWERHVPLLLEALERDKKNARALFYLARSYDTLQPFFSPEERVTFAMLSMSYYMRRMALPFPTTAERNCIRLYYLDCARVAGVYSETELFARARELSEDDPTRPESALLMAQLSLKFSTVKQVYELAAHAARVAEAAAGGFVDGSPVSSACAWQAHHLAAVAMRQMITRAEVAGNDTASLRETMRDHVAAGLEAGGEWSVFQALAVPVELPTEKAAEEEQQGEPPPEAA